MVNKFFWIVFLVVQVSQVSSFWFFPESAIDFKWTEQRHFRHRRQEKIDCKNLNVKHTLQQIIDENCVNIRSNSGFKIFKITEEPNNWSRFAANLRGIKEILFQFESSSLEAIEFPNITSAVSSGFKFINNSQLTLINIKTVNHLNLKILDISDNPKLKTIKLSAGPGSNEEWDSNGLSGSDVLIKGNPQLKTIDMNEIEHMTPSSFVIEDNIMLKEIKLRSLLMFGVTSFDLIGNIALENFELPKLQEFSVNSALIKNNNKLSRISFSRSASVTVQLSLAIGQNKNLTEIEMDYTKVVTPNLRVRGNPKLPKEALVELDKIQVSDKKDIQKVGECIFDDKFLIKDFADFEDCQIISSPLKFTNSTTGAIGNSQLKTINGDVDLAGLCIERVNFLETVTISGTIKSDVCNLQLTNHAVNSPNCSETTCAAYVPPSTTTIATTTIETIAQTENTPSEPVATPPQTSESRNSTGKLTDSGKNTANAGSSSTVGIIIGVIVAIIVIAVIIIVCICVPVPAGGGRKDKVKMYERVCGCQRKSDKVYSQVRPEKRTEESNTKESATLTGSQEKTRSTEVIGSKEGSSRAKTPKSDKVRKDKSVPPRKQKTQNKMPALKSVALKSTKIPKPRPTEEVTATPLLEESHTPPSLDSVSAPSPPKGWVQWVKNKFDWSQPKTAKAKESSREVPKPTRYHVSKGGTKREQPRKSYQHEFLNNMEDFLGNEENYADVIEEVKSDNEQNNSKKGNGSAKKKDHRKQ